MSAAGLYVPGGQASYPSSVLMNAVPARVAGVGRLVVCVPTPGGEVNPLVMRACRIAGVDEIYRVGGAQAIAAMAYGTTRIRPVDKITGPGNAYVAAAKRHVRDAIERVAGRLGNTPTICRKCYIHPQVIDSYLARDLVLEVQEEIADELDAGGLQGEEARVLRFLEQRLSEVA